MKKFLIVLAVIITVSLACTKIDPGGRLCGCTPPEMPTLFLSVKNTAGNDLLSDKTTGGYTKDQIQLYKKDGAGNKTALYWGIRPPFTYWTEKFEFNTIITSDLAFLLSSPDTNIFLSFAGGKEYKLKVQLNQGKYAVEKLAIDDKEAVKDTGSVAKYRPLFYLIQ